MMTTKNYTSTLQRVVQDECSKRSQHTNAQDGLGISEMEAMA